MPLPLTVSKRGKMMWTNSIAHPAHTINLNEFHLRFYLAYDVRWDCFCFAERRMCVCDNVNCSSRSPNLRYLTPFFYLLSMHHLLFKSKFHVILIWKRSKETSNHSMRFVIVIASKKVNEAISGDHQINASNQMQNIIKDWISPFAFY